MIKSLEIFKKMETLNAEMISEQAEERKKIRYVEREEDPEMKKAFEEEKHRYENLHETLKDQIDGQIDLDMHGNVTIREYKKEGESKKEEGGIQGPGTYVLRNGKLVPGTGEIREHA